jgi:GNAT superfamily N-acetyltransferase
MKIRKMTKDDAPAISKILRDLGWFGHLKEESFQETEQRVKKHIALCLQDESHTMFVAENTNGEVIGYAAVHWLPYLMLKAPEGYVSELFVADSERGKGVGSQLLEVAREEAKRRGCSRLSLLSIKHRESYKRGFYKKRGWTEREEASNFVLVLES